MTAERYMSWVMLIDALERKSPKLTSDALYGLVDSDRSLSPAHKAALKQHDLLKEIKK